MVHFGHIFYAVIRVLERIGEQHGFPNLIISDNGPEFTGSVLDKLCYTHGIRLSIITPGKPTENGFIESFNGKSRDECLDMNWFFLLDQANTHH